MTPDPLNRLVAQLAKLPGIGEKTAQRLAFHILRAPGEYAAELSQAIREVKEKVHLCVRCFSSPTRRPATSAGMLGATSACCASWRRSQT